MRSTGTPRMRATVGVLRRRLHLPAGARAGQEPLQQHDGTSSDTTSTPSCACDTVTPATVIGVSGSRVGKVCASAL